MTKEGDRVFRHYKYTRVIAIGFLIIVSIPILVDSQTHGLIWGFEPGEKFYFKETHTSSVSNSTVRTLSFEFYLIAGDYLEIPDPLTNFPIDREDTFFLNGTNVMAGGLYFAVPIGNWELLESTYSSFYSSYYDTINYIDEDTIWGYMTTLDYEDRVESRTYLFSKTDGVIVSLSYQITHDTFYNLSILVERIPPPVDITVIGFILGGFSILIIVCGVYFLRREKVVNTK